MTWLIRLLRLILRALLEVLVALLFLPFALVFGLIALLLALWEWLYALWQTKNFSQEDKEKACRGLPEGLIRRPDPCLYSQTLLAAQGLPVTWNNPDIWMARADQPANIEPDSYHLQENTGYLVSVRVHNASTDLALGVKVRLNYRPWSFNSPNLMPVETDSMGNEVFRYVDVMPMGASVATFRWRTPAVATGSQHYCLQASVSHPLDTNTANNMGQENTDVYSSNPGAVEPGELLEFDVPLHNGGLQVERFRFTADQYKVDFAVRHKLYLKASCGYASWPLSRRMANFVPVLRDFTHEHPPGPDCPSERKAAVPCKPNYSLGRLRFGATRRLRAVRTKYIGFEGIRRAILGRDTSLPAGMQVRVAGRNPGVPIEMKPGETRPVPFSIRIPADIPRGSQFPVNLVALRADGVLAGGVTLLLKVKE
jgi:hypothetical protein